MTRCLLCSLFLLPLASVRAQDEQPQLPDLPQGGETGVEADPPPGRVRLVRDTGGHVAKPRYLVFTPDGKRLISTADDQTVQVWDVVSGERLRVFRAPLGMDGKGGLARRDVGDDVVVDRKGDRLAFCVQARDEAGKVISTTFVCSLESGHTQILKHFGPRAFTPDGQSLVTGKGRELLRTELGSGKSETIPFLPLKERHTIANLSYSPDGGTLAVVASDNAVYLLNAATLKRRKLWKVPGADANLRSVGWADDKTLICRSLARSKALVVLDAATGTLKRSYSQEQLQKQLPQGHKNTEQLLDIQALPGTTRAFVRVKRILSSGHHVNVSFLLDWATGEQSKAFASESALGCDATAMAPDLKLGAQGDDVFNDILLWNPETGRTFRESRLDADGKEAKVHRRLRAAVHGASGWYWSIRWHLDGRTLVWEALSDGRKHDYFKLLLPKLELLKIPEKTFHAYGKKVEDQILGGKKPTQADIDQRRSIRGIRHRWEQGDTKLSLREKKTDKFILEIHGGPQVVTLDKFSHPVHWDYTFVAGGRVLLHGWDSTALHVFDSTTGKRLHSAKVTQSYVQSLAVSSRDPRLVLVGSVDQTLTVYNSETNKVILTVFPSGQDWIAWTPQGYYAATPGGERLMGWHVENGPEKLASFYPADRFRKTLYRPDVIKLVLAKGNVADALKEANAALPKERRPPSDTLADVSKLLPPRVTLSLVEQDNKGVVKLRTTIEAGPKASPILALRLTVDGRAVPGEEYVKFFTADKQPTTAIDWPKLELPAGEHQVVVLVEGAASTASNGLTLSSRPATDKPVLHVLAIGVDKYQDTELNLRCASRDARDLAEAFEKSCKGALFGDVRPTVLVNDKATRANILKALKELRTDPSKRVRGNDLVVIFFAGHGVKDREQFYLLPHDTDLKNLSDTALSGATLRQELKDLQGRVLFLMDACQSAGFGEKGYFLKKKLRPATDEATRTLTDDEVGVVVMCAAMGAEEALEVGDHGLFTRFLIEALKKNKGVPYNAGNRRQYIHHLWSHVSDKVVIESRDRQHPFLHLPWIVKTFPVRQVPETASGSR